MRMRAWSYQLPFILLIFSIFAGGTENKSVAASFPVASVHFEQNATDGDVEVIFEVNGGDEGLVELVIVAPDGRKVVDFKAPDPATLGMRKFGFESPEPRDVKSLKAAYPEGVYDFSGKTLKGAKLVGKSRLSHRLPPAVTFKRPAPGAKGVAPANLDISWSAVGGVAAYIIEIEQDKSDVNVTARLNASATSFSVPNGFLRPATEYKIAIGTVSNEGNVSYVETSFMTGK